MTRPRLLLRWHLGSLIQVNGVQYILSNYHVFEADIVSGGNNLVAATGQIYHFSRLNRRAVRRQPGCGCRHANQIGALPDSNVDAGDRPGRPRNGSL